MRFMMNTSLRPCEGSLLQRDDLSMLVVDVSRGGKHIVVRALCYNGYVIIMSLRASMRVQKLAY